MTFNGLTDGQAESSRRKYGSCRPDNSKKPSGLVPKLKERFGRIPVKVYIILYLLYIAYCIVSAVGGGSAELLVSVLPVVPAVIIGMIISCLAEIYTEKSSARQKKKRGSRIYKVYRCGNTVTEIPAEEIVRGDYVLLTAGDVCPAEGIVLHGDITAEKDGKSSLIRNFKEEELAEDISGSYTVERNAVISSGYAVVKITSVENQENGVYLVKNSKIYTLGIALGVVLAAALTVFYVLSAVNDGTYGTHLNRVATAAVYYASLLLLASEGLKQPKEFFRSANRNTMRINGVRAEELTGLADYIFADKSGLATDGRPVVTGFTDGTGASCSKFYEIPYPLGTIIARAAAENTSALVNRGKIIGADAYECAEMNFMSERIKSTLDLEITPELIKGQYSRPECRKLLKGTPDEIIAGCKAYFDGSGNVKPLSNTAALSAMAEELVFQGSRVFAYAAENYDGSRVFIGMITVHEKLRSSAAAAFKQFADFGSKVIMLAEGSSAEAVSIADKAVTGAASDEIISFEALEKLEVSEAEKKLKKIRIITGKADREYLIGLVHGMKKTVGVTACSYSDLEAAEEADVIYAASSGCMAARDSADAVLYDGFMSMLNYGKYCRSIKTAAAGYNAFRLFMLVLSAVMMNAAVVNSFGNIAYYAAIVLNILFSAAACVLFGKLSKGTDRD